MNRRRDRGQALLEFAVILPVFLTMFFGIVDFGRVVWANNSLTNAASEAARYAIVHGGNINTPCPVGPTLRRPDTIPSASSSCPYPSVPAGSSASLVAQSKLSIVNVASGYAIAGGLPITVTVCYGVGCTGNTDTGTNARGTPITVVLSSTVTLVTASLLGMSSFGVSGSSTMLVNH